MCGIAGYVGKAKLSRERIEKALDTMQRRGPDALGVASFTTDNSFIYLLHTRLSIIDLDARSNQPFRRGAVTVAFNGEIYNYRELRAELEKENVAFSTSSDTEVLVACYEKFGPECVQRFEGMWSFALYDEAKRSLFLSRDRFGEKPLYYFANADGVYFASEIKALQALLGETLNPDNSQVLRYLVHGYKSLYKTPHTFFEKVREIQPATWVEISPAGLSQSVFWKPSYRPCAMTREEAVLGIRERLFRSMELRLRADVPLAFCLSGGIDSSSLVSVAAKQFGCHTRCYSILDSDERYDERKNIEATAKDIGCHLTAIELHPEKSFDRLQKVLEYHDAPIATITYYIHSLLSERISADGVKVVFSGTAADELFTGYYDHHNLFLYEMRAHPHFRQFLTDWETHIRPVVRNPYLQDPYLYFENPYERGHILLNSAEFGSYLKVPFTEAFTEENFCESLLRNRMLNEVFHEATRVILHEDDLNSMMFSLENRSPYLDTDLFEFAYSIPSELLISNGYGKSLLREALQGTLNDTVRLDRQKKGFNAAIHSVFDLNDAELKEIVLADGPIYSLVRKDKIEAVMGQSFLTNSFSKFLFSFINARLFLDRFA